MTTTVTQASSPSIFQQLGNQIGVLRVTEDAVTNPLGLTLRFYDEIITDPMAFTNSFMAFARNATPQHMAAINMAYRTTAIMNADTHPQLSPNLNDKLIEILGKISPKTVESAATAFNKLKDHITSGGTDLDSFRYLGKGNPLPAEAMRRLILRDLTDTCDPLADDQKLEFPELSASAVLQDRLFEELRIMRNGILANLSPVATKVAKELLNDELIPGVLSEMAPTLAMPTLTETNHLEIIRNHLQEEVDGALALIAPLETKVMIELEASLSADPTRATGLTDLVERVVPALIRSLNSPEGRAPANANSETLLLRCSLVSTILHSNLIKFAAAAKAEAQATSVLASLNLKDDQ